MDAILKNRDALQEAKAPPPARAGRWGRLLPIAVFVLFFGIVVGIQALRGGLGSSFAEFPDEPAHAVTGLMFYEYLRNPQPLHPIRYAEEYYVSYPKVSIGNWPPVFYGMQGIWMHMAGASRTSLLLFMPFLAGILATLVYMVVRALAGPWIGLLSGAALLSMPLVQQFGGSLMAEIPVAIFMLGAALSFARYLETERLAWSLAFGVFATLAILTKGNGLMLALLPPLALLLHGGKWHLLKKPSLWLSTVPVLLFCTPWYAMTLHLSRDTWAGEAGLAYFMQALGVYGASIPRIAGAGVGLLALVGLLAGRTRPEWRSTWACVVAIVPALLLLHSVIPSSLHVRHMLPVGFVVAILFGMGASTLARLRPWAGPSAAAAAVLLAIATAGAPPRKDIHGYEKVAREVLADRSLDDGVMLIASDSIGEGAFVSEIALQARDGNRTVLRGSKVLVDEGWLNRRSKPLVKGVDELIRYLQAIPVAVVVLDTNLSAGYTRPYHGELRKAFDSRPDLFEARGVYASVRGSRRIDDGLRVYVLRNYRALPRARIDLDLVRGKRQP